MPNIMMRIYGGTVIDMGPPCYCGHSRSMHSVKKINGPRNSYCYSCGDPAKEMKNGCKKFILNESEVQGDENS